MVKKAVKKNMVKTFCALKNSAIPPTPGHLETKLLTPTHPHPRASNPCPPMPATLPPFPLAFHASHISPQTDLPPSILRLRLRRGMSPGQGGVQNVSFSPLLLLPPPPPGWLRQSDGREGKECLLVVRCNLPRGKGGERRKGEKRGKGKVSRWKRKRDFPPLCIPSTTVAPFFQAEEKPSLLLTPGYRPRKKRKGTGGGGTFTFLGITSAEGGRKGRRQKERKGKEGFLRLLARLQLGVAFTDRAPGYLKK